MNGVKRALLILLFINSIYGQKVLNYSFEVESEQYNYSYIEKDSTDSFTVIFLDKDCEYSLELIKKCCKESTYVFKLDQNITLTTDAIFVSLLADILSKKKLIDKKMNLISTIPVYEYYSYFLKYNKKHNGVLLNKINLFKIINKKIDCESLN